MPAGLADKRVALIVGNGAYEHADPLANPVNDARNVRKALSKLGFGDEDTGFVKATGRDWGRNYMAVE